MPSLRLAIRTNQPLKNGGYRIFIAVGAYGKTAYISTNRDINSLGQWQGGRVVKHSQAKAMNLDLAKLLAEYQGILDKMPNPHVSAIEVRDYLNANFRRAASVVEFGRGIVEELLKEGRKSHANNIKCTMDRLEELFGKHVTFADITPASLKAFEDYLRKQGNSDTTIRVRLSRLEGIMNTAVNQGLAEYRVFPFRLYTKPPEAVRETYVSKSELRRFLAISEEDRQRLRTSLAYDLFLLSFFLGGINLIDLVDARVDGDALTYVRRKTAGKKHGEKTTSITIQPEAREIINKYIQEDGKLNFAGEKYSYNVLRTAVTQELSIIGRRLGFERKLMYYSARKTFVQFGMELGIPLYVLEYAIGQTVKDAVNRPIFNYIKMMRHQADLAIRTIIDYALYDDGEEELPIPDWARRK